MQPDGLLPFRPTPARSPVLVWSLFDPSFERGFVDVQHEHGIEQVDELGEVSGTTTEEGDRFILGGDDGFHLVQLPTPVLGPPQGAALIVGKGYGLINSVSVFGISYVG